MAVQFTKPKRFTKEWWEYIWYYNKWYVFGSIFVIIAIAITIAQEMLIPDYSMNIMYVGNDYIEKENMALVISDLNDIVKEEKKDGILFEQLNYNYTPGKNIDNTLGVARKLQIQMSVDETMVFIFDKSRLGIVMNTGSYGSMWTPVSEWADIMPHTDNIKEEYGVSLKNSKLLKKHGIDCENLYVAVKKLHEKNNKKSIKKYNYSVEVANKLLEE